MKLKIIYIIALLVVSCNFTLADSTNVSLRSLNKKKFYTSFSFGMGAQYGNNPSLKNFIGYEIPNYSYLTRDDQLSEFSTGLDFFGGIERQVSKNFSLKGEYSYFIKSYNVKLYPQYDFSYYNHQPTLMAFYIIPQEYSFIKIGAGAGYVYSNLTVREYGSEKSYSSNGVGLKTEVVFNAQIGKSFTGYISGYLIKTFSQNLKDSNGKELLSSGANETVNLSTFGAGLRLGVEIFFF